MDLSRVDRVLHTIDPAKLAATGLTITGVTVALLPVRGAPNAATVWTALTSYTAPTTAVIRLAGPDADPTAALVVPAECDLWAEVTDGTQVEAVKIERLTIKGSNGSIPALLDPAISTLNGKHGPTVTLTFSDVGADASGAATAAQAAAATDATTKANAAQAYAVQRANHTGTQAATTLTGLDAAVAALLADRNSATYAQAIALPSYPNGA